MRIRGKREQLLLLLCIRLEHTDSTQHKIVRNCLISKLQYISQHTTEQGCGVGVGGVACFQLESESGVGVGFSKLLESESGVGVGAFVAITDSNVY